MSGVGEKECDGSEDIAQLQSPYTDTSQLRVTNMVYKAVYAIAHAIHRLICEDRANGTARCDKHSSVQPEQVVYMNFMTMMLSETFINYIDLGDLDGPVVARNSKLFQIDLND